MLKTVFDKANYVNQIPKLNTANQNNSNKSNKSAEVTTFNNKSNNK